MFLLVLAYPGSPGPRAVKRLCGVCVCVCVCVCNYRQQARSASVVIMVIQGRILRFEVIAPQTSCAVASMGLKFARMSRAKLYMFFSGISEFFHSLSLILTYDLDPRKYAREGLDEPAC